MPTEQRPSESPLPPSDRSDGIEDLAAELERLGAETPVARSVKRIVPWLASLGVHALLVVLGFLLTWTVVLLKTDEDIPVIIADFEDVQYAPVSRLEQTPLTEVTELVQEQAPIAPPQPARDPAEFELDPLDLLAGPLTSAPLTRFLPEDVALAASFVGLSTTNARRVVYVIDASGSMIRAFPVVMEELARSLDGLTSEQAFSVIFFQRNKALVVPPGNRLITATEDEKVRVLEWADDHVIPAGRSNPLAALERALSLEPDAIFLLSENITGSGEFEIDQHDLFAMLDQLNPRDRKSGRRRTTINCIQFLDPDPLQTLEKIAAEHGGPRGFKFLDRAELGMGMP